MTYTRKEVIGDCTLYLGDCLEVMPLVGKVDAVVDNSDAVVFNQKHEKSAKRQRCTPNKSSKGVGVTQGGYNGSVCEWGEVSGADGGEVRNFSGGVPEGSSAVRDTAEVEGQGRKSEREVYRRDAKHSISDDDRENTLQQVRKNEPASNTPHRRSSYEQRKEQSGSSLLPVSQQPPQAGMVGQAKISILTNPPYGIGIAAFHVQKWGVNLSALNWMKIILTLPVSG